MSAFWVLMGIRRRTQRFRNLWLGIYIYCEIAIKIRLGQINLLLTKWYYRRLIKAGNFHSSSPHVSSIQGSGPRDRGPWKCWDHHILYLHVYMQLSDLYRWKIGPLGKCMYVALIKSYGCILCPNNGFFHAPQLLEWRPMSWRRNLNYNLTLKWLNKFQTFNI